MANASKDSGYYRYSDEEKAQHLKDWAASGETQQAYAETSGVSPGTLAKWKAAAEKKNAAKAKRVAKESAAASDTNGSASVKSNGNGNGHGNGKNGGAKVFAAGDNAVVSTSMTMAELVAQNIELRGLVKQLGRML